MPTVDSGVAGTATVQTTISRKSGEWLPAPIHGSFFKNDANFDKFVDKSIDPSADRNKLKDSKYLIQCNVPNDFEIEGEVTKAVITFEKISKNRFSNGKEQKTKTCVLENPLVIPFDGGFFLCCDSEKLNKSKFLEENSKEFRANQTLDLDSKSFHGLGTGWQGLPKFIPFGMSQCQSQSNIFQVDKEGVYGKLKETGPLLKDDKTIVGYYRKSNGHCRIEIQMFGKIQDDPDNQTPCHEANKKVTEQGTEVMSSNPSEKDPEPSVVSHVPNGKGDFDNQDPQLDKELLGKKLQDLQEEKETIHMRNGYLQLKWVKREREEDGYPKPKWVITEREEDGDLVQQQESLERARREEQEWGDLRLVCLERARRKIQEWVYLLCHLLEDPIYEKHLDRCILHHAYPLALRLKAPKEIQERIKSNIQTSPTLQLLSSKASNLNTDSLVEILRKMSRNDEANRISNRIPGYYSVETALAMDKKLFQAIARRLDTASTNNWRTLGLHLELQRDELNQIESNPAGRLLKYAYKELPADELTVGRFEEFKTVVEGPKMNLKNPEEYYTSIKEVIPLGSEKMRMLCLHLNGEVRGLPRWKRLARCWNISDEISSQFEKSPTEILLKDWLIVERPDFTVNELCRILGEIGCYEGKEFLERQLEEWYKKHM